MHTGDLGDRVRYLEKAHRAGEELGEEVGSQTEAEHGHVELVYDAAHLVDILGCEELALVRDDHVSVIFVKREELEDVIGGLDGRAFCQKTYSRLDKARSVTVVEKLSNQNL